MTSALAAQQAPVARPYQVSCLNTIERLFEEGVRRVVLSIATGGGKTFCAVTHIRKAVAAGQRVLILVHRVELLEQFSQTLDGMDLDHGVIKAGHGRYRPSLPVQVASIQTLVLRLRGGSRIDADLLVVDECHRAMASTYREVLDGYPSAQVLGLTATPWRLDNKGLGDVFQKIVLAASTKDLVADGYLIEPTVYVPSKRLDFSKLKVVCGDYKESELNELVNNAAVCGRIIEHWMEHAKGMSTIVFAVSIEHSKRVAHQFLEAGVAAEHVDGTTDPLERDAIFGRLKSGVTQVLTNVDICTEGFDFPDLRCVVLARPTKSVVRFLQSAGRVMRVCPGKSRAVCLDHAGSFLEHGFPSDPRDFSLERTEPAAKPTLRECPACKALMHSGAGHCSACGWRQEAVNEDKEGGQGDAANDDADKLVLLRPEDRFACPKCGGYQVRVIHSAKLGPFTVGIECKGRNCGRTPQWVKNTEKARQAPEPTRRREWARLQALCAQKGWGPAWAVKQYSQLFGCQPEWS